MKIPEQELAKVVICNAYIDATSLRDSADRRSARAFLMGYSKGYEESLILWCQMANISHERIMKKARQMERENNWTRKPK